MDKSLYPEEIRKAGGKHHSFLLGVAVFISTTILTNILDNFGIGIPFFGPLLAFGMYFGIYRRYGVKLGPYAAGYFVLLIIALVLFTLLVAMIGFTFILLW